MNIAYALIIAALVVFILAAIPIPSRVNLIAIGLALLTLAQLMGRIVLLFLFVLMLHGCETTKMKSVVPTITTVHPATKLCPWTWTDERERIVHNDASETLYHEGKIIPGVPR